LDFGWSCVTGERNPSMGPSFSYTFPTQTCLVRYPLMSGSDKVTVHGKGDGSTLIPITDGDQTRCSASTSLPSIRPLSGPVQENSPELSCLSTLPVTELFVLHTTFIHPTTLSSQIHQQSISTPSHHLISSKCLPSASPPPRWPPWPPSPP
jgi:hypothetical protein